ncbi:SUMF1/EgtB/PvdO family nonheme iron enzyme, partial [Deltaproteobacteria bacterium TL4]
TTNTSDTACSGSIQLFTSIDASSDSSFNNCVPMSASPVASDKDKTFTVTPASALSTSTRYKIRVTTDVTDYTGNALESQYTTGSFIKNEVPTIFAARGDSQNTLTWSSVTGAASYNLYWSTTTGVTTSDGTKISGVTSPYTHTSLTNGTAYYYILTAVNIAGESSASTEVSMIPADLFAATSSSMVSISGGTFQMGSTNGGSDETPVHSVTLSAFYISEHETTVGEYKLYDSSASSYSCSADSFRWCIFPGRIFRAISPG